MADPTLALTFNDLRIRVAEFLGVAYYGANGDEAAQLPTDAHDLDMVGRIVNDGYRRFVTEREWNFLKPTFEITFDPDGSTGVDGDAWRYYLPDDFYGSIVGALTYPTTGPISEVRPFSEQQIRALRTGGDSTGYPTAYAVRPVNTTAASDGSRWEILFWPTPSAVLTVTGRYRRFPNKLANATDRHVCGFQHDEAVLAAALAAAELQRDDQVGAREMAYTMALARSKTLDERASAKRRGSYGDRSEDRFTGGPGRVYDGADTYNGVDV